MHFFHVTPSLAFGDAISNDIFALIRIARERGIACEIFSTVIDTRLPCGTARYVNDFPQVKKDDIVFFHLSTGTSLNEWIKTVPCRKIMLYHNITPPEFFHGYYFQAEENCRRGLVETQSLQTVFDMVFADSSFNKQNLIDMGYGADIKVLPVLIPFSDYEKAPSDRIINAYSQDGFTNILFVGRLAPNKCQQDVITAFDAYQRNFNPKSRLFIVGNPCPDSYRDALMEYTRLLGTENVIFTGHTKFDEILAYYHLCDLFLCQSEHEGFCVPLVEAMYFHKPIVAYDSSAIGETLGGGGFLLKEKNPMETAAVMNRILTDNSLRKVIVGNQDERLQYFSYERIRDLFWSYMDEFIGGKQ